MDVKTLFTVIEPHLETMDPQQKQSLSKLIVGFHNKSFCSGRPKILSLKAAKNKLKLFRRGEMLKERT